MAWLGQELMVLTGLLAFLAFVLLSTYIINRNRKLRVRARRITARLLDWR